MKPEARVGPMRLDGPVVLASGILGISLDVFRRLHRSGAGAVVTKSLSKSPWTGYANPTVIGLDNGGWLNAVGLSNPGAQNFADMIRPNREIPIIVSLVGSTAAEFEYMIDKFDECAVVAYELNMSCPHVAKVGLEVGDDPALVREIVGAAKQASGDSAPVLVKVGLGSSNYLDTVGAAIDGGADAITAINTIRSMAIDAELQRPVLSNRFGGLSGAPIKPIALRCVYEIASRFGDIPIMGCGGISNWKDAVEFILAGASAVQIGSVLGEEDVDIFGRINTGITEYMERKGIDRLQDMVGHAQRR